MIGSKLQKLPIKFPYRWNWMKMRLLMANVILPVSYEWKHTLVIYEMKQSKVLAATTLCNITVVVIRSDNGGNQGDHGRKNAIHRMNSDDRRDSTSSPKKHKDRKKIPEDGPGKPESQRHTEFWITKGSGGSRAGEDQHNSNFWYDFFNQAKLLRVCKNRT